MLTDAKLDTTRSTIGWAIDSDKSDSMETEDGKYVFIQTNAPNYMPAQKGDIEDLKQQINELTDIVTASESEKKRERTKKILEGEPILTVKFETPQMDATQKFRIISLFISALLGGGMVALGITIFDEHIYESLYCIALSLPALGIATSCVLALWKGKEYDQGESNG